MAAQASHSPVVFAAFVIAYFSGGSLHLTAHSSALLCVQSMGTMHSKSCYDVCVKKAQVTKTFYPNIMQTLRNVLFSAVSLKKKCCFLSQQPNFYPTQTCDWNKKGGGECCWWGGWITGSTETSCSGAYWSYLGYLHIIFRVKSGTKINATSETGRGCSQFLP